VLASEQTSCQPETARSQTVRPQEGLQQTEKVKFARAKISFYGNGDCILEYKRLDHFSTEVIPATEALCAALAWARMLVVVSTHWQKQIARLSRPWATSEQ